MEEKQMGAASSFEVAAGTEQGNAIGDLVRGWLQIRHADKLRVVDPITETWVSMSEQEKLLGPEGRYLNRCFLLCGDADDEFEEGIYKVVGVKGDFEVLIVQRDGTDDYAKLNREAFKDRLIQALD